jgi:hypothetical protein
MLKLLSQLVSLAVLSTPAVAAEVLETGSFAMTLPAGWVKNLQSKPVSAQGPNGELLQVSSVKLQGSGAPSEAKRIRVEMEQNIVRAIERAANSPELKTVKAMRQTQIGSGVTMHEMVSEASDRS